MPATYEAKPPFRLENLESVNRILNIPIVHSGINIAENVYDRVKKTNHIIAWTFDQAEETVKCVVQNPAVSLLEVPLSTIDKVICKSLDIVESKIPSINLPPQLIYSNTKDYISDVSTKIVKPVLKRADSVKQIGNTVLTSKYTEYAADKLDDALDVADAYIDKYLPDQEDQRDHQDTIIPGTVGKKALHTMQHADRVSRKLQRRLTKRTLEHAKIIKEQGTEAIHVLIYVAELITTDPVLALQKGKELWVELSKDEPENQARPENVEELFVLLVRESARQMVHFVNYSTYQISKLPQLIARTTHDTIYFLENTLNSLKNTLHLEEIEKHLIIIYKHEAALTNFILQEINSIFRKALEQARIPDAEPSEPTPSAKVVLTVPKIEVNSKASSHKGNGVSSHNHHKHVNHHGQHGHHGHHGKKNGAQSPSRNNGSSDHHEN